MTTEKVETPSPLLHRLRPQVHTARGGHGVELLTAACTSDPTERACSDFSGPDYAYAGGTTIVDLYGIDALDLLGLPLFVVPAGQTEGSLDAQPVGGERWQVKAVRWNGEIGKAVLLAGRDECTAMWLEGE